MSISAEFRFASPSEEKAVRQLLAECGLPSADVSMERQDFILAVSERRIVGCVALEPYGDSALLRSFAVAPDQRGQGVGNALFDRVMARAALRGAKTAYVLTTTAERYCARKGFEKVDRGDVPASVATSAEFRTLCPATAVCMRRRLEDGVRHFPTDVLRLHPDVPGASMWAVALERTMLTYFEIEPRSRFETHSHASEQITMVLEGELFFEVAGGAELLVRAGEVIAIPANAPHAAWTGERPARAVDAWSPVRPDLIR